jgi:hypothetical protein
MELLTKLKLGVGGIFLTIILILWAFGGILGAIIGVANDDALNAVLSLLIPAYGAIYTVIMALSGMF